MGTPSEFPHDECRGKFSLVRYSSRPSAVRGRNVRWYRKLNSDERGVQRSDLCGPHGQAGKDGVRSEKIAR